MDADLPISDGCKAGAFFSSPCLGFNSAINPVTPLQICRNDDKKCDGLIDAPIGSRRPSCDEFSGFSELSQVSEAVDHRRLAAGVGPSHSLSGSS
jgi:hypothetical protein